MCILLVFDRMFSLGVRGSGVEAAPLTARAVGAAAPAGLKRHFLYCSLKPEIYTKTVSLAKGPGPSSANVNSISGTSINGSASLGVSTNNNNNNNGNRITRDGRGRSFA